MIVRGEVELLSRTCWKPMITARSHAFLRYYQHYKNGVLPYGGGLLEQPAAYLDAMELIERFLDDG